jgi:hypothetical protein
MGKREIFSELAHTPGVYAGTKKHIKTKRCDENNI